MASIDRFLVELWVRHGRQQDIGAPLMLAAEYMIRHFYRLPETNDECHIGALIDEALASVDSGGTLSAQMAVDLRACLLRTWGEMYAAVCRERTGRQSYSEMNWPIPNIDRILGHHIETSDTKRIQKSFSLTRVVEHALTWRWDAMDTAAYLRDRYRAASAHTVAKSLVPPSGVHFDSHLAAFYDWLLRGPYLPKAFSPDCLLGYSLARDESRQVFVRYMHDENNLCMRRRLADPALASRPGCAWLYRADTWRRVPNR